MRQWVEQWMSIHSLLLLLSTVLLWFTGLLPLLFIPVAASFLLFFIWQARSEGHWNFFLEAANLVTIFRLLVLWLLLWKFALVPPLALGLLAILVLCLDGLDGYLARKYQTSSVFGEYLDMETDAFYVLGLSVILYELEYFNAWILGIGLLRYSYFLVLRNVKAPAQKEARIYFARLVAVILMATMGACFILPPIIHQPAMIIASGLVLYSFANSFYLAVRFSLAKKSK